MIRLTEEQKSTREMVRRLADQERVEIREYRIIYEIVEDVEKAVKGMLPKNRIAADMLTKLRVFAGPKHTHEAANPQKISV